MVIRTVNISYLKSSALQKALGIFIWGIMFFLCIPLSASDYHAFIAQGDKYYQNFDNKKALTEYQKAYDAAPENYEALMKLTRAYNDVGEDLNSDESEAYFKKAVEYAELLTKKSPASAEAYFYLALAYGNLALFKGGKEKVKLSRNIEKNAKKSIELDSEFAHPYVVLGVYYREVANLNWFLKAFAKTIFGGLPDGTNEDSEKMLLKAIELTSNHSILIYTHYELAGTYELMGKIEKSVENLKKVVELPIIDHQDPMKKADAKKKLSKLQKQK